MSKVLPYDSVEFTNHRGDILVPGQAAIAVTCGMGRACLRVGKYLGVRKSTSYGQETRCVLMQVQNDVKRLVHKDTDEPWDDDAAEREFPRPNYCDRNTWGGEKSYYPASAAYYEKLRLVQAERGYVWKNFAEVGHTTLQNNMIYPGDIALVDNVTL